MTPNDFWNQDTIHRDQKFYTAFCILQSALSDYSLGCDLRNRNCLNWSATAYYYSMVHATRLICFLAVGDFPTNHQKLASLFSSSGKFKTTWLNNFNGTQGMDLSCSIILNYYSQSSIIKKPLLERIGKILTLSCDCRNDSNYEMLLMAHELDHQYVSPSFDNLTKSLGTHAESFFPVAIDAFKIFIDTDGGTQHPRSNYWYSYLNWHKENEGLGHIKKFITHRLQDNMSSEKQESSQRIQFIGSILNKNDHWIQPLKILPVNEDFANEVYENCKYDVFIGKKKLMRDFSQDVSELGRI
jgi:hypothetical protein